MIQTREFGTTKDGAKITLYTFTNKKGTEASFINYGAILVSLKVADKDGKFEDVVLGYDELDKYTVNGPNFGSTIGRFANRIGGASFTLNGKTYPLEKNDGNNSLHGGFDGFHKRVWNAKTCESECGSSITFTYVSKDGDQGYPGNLTMYVTYTLTEDDEIRIDYEAVSDADTVINLTNHSYFNLAGHASGSVLDQKVVINSDAITQADQESIPHGEIIDVTGTPMDFRKEKAIGDEIDADYDQLVWAGGYDHNWIVNTKPGQVSFVASMYDDKSGRFMQVYTDQPGMQFYTGNFLDGTEIGKGGAVYEKRSAACFETQYFPNAINVPSFEQPVLKAGDLYRTTTIYRFSVR